ncbi:MAG: tetratricopeptide repeat protein [Verrucomicrobia bacterium]|nr:tetratricopeptide repeat protein [Verrucomicrobiota bacterium]
MEYREHSTFASRRLPWLIAAGAVIVYLITLNRWVSLSGLPMAVMLTDASGSTPLSGPLTFLLTYPLRWLPVSAQLHALNGLSALLAAVTLGLLVRTVALIPQDRTRDQRHRERSETGLLSLPTAWLPPLVAALTCGLQLAFWQHATAGTGQMINLALLAYLVLCLVEFRIDERESRLTRLALVYGLATTNNPALIAMFPLFVLGLIWIRGREFFRLRFVMRMVAFGLAGLSLYLILPLLSQLSETSAINFWTALHHQLVEQKNLLLGIPRYVVLFGALFSILPLAFIGIRWPSSFGDTSVAGVLLTNLLFRVVHALFLAGCLWVVLDAPFSPRVLVDNLQIRTSAEVTAGLPFLGFHYLTSLCVGYFVGYFLLLSTQPAERNWRRTSPLDRLSSQAFGLAAWVLALAIPATLIYRNWVPIRANDGRLLRDFAALTLRGIPETNAVALADDPLLLNLVRILDRQARGGEDRLMIYTPLLRYAAYQQSLKRLFPERWASLPAEVPSSAVLYPHLLALQVYSIVATNPAYYLHPSFGYFFEQVYLQPDGLAGRLSIYTTNDIAPPPLTAELRQRNAAFWDEASPQLQTLPPLVARRVPDARAVGRWYSRALNYWGVELQQLNHLEDAGRHFALATRLNPDNIVAAINLEYNQSLRRHSPSRVDLAKSAEEQFGPKYRSWDSFLAANGPIDEPGFRIRLGRLLDKQDNLRQAILQYRRAVELEPENRPALIELAELYLRFGLAQSALQTTAKLRELRATPEEQIQFIRLEAGAQAFLGDTTAAENTLLDALRIHPSAESLMDTLAELYKITDQPDKALQICDRQLALNPRATAALIRKAVIYMKQADYAQAESTLNTLSQVAPDSVTALLTQSAFLIQTRRYPEALQIADRLIKLDPQNQWALINRAIALLQSDKLDEAKAAYLELHERMPREHRFHFGLGEIAYRQNQTAEAIKFYELYLQNAPANTDEARQIDDRLRQLRAQAH